MVPATRGQPVSRPHCSINSLHGRPQVSDAAPERVVVTFAHDNIYVTRVVVDQRLAQWSEVGRRAFGSLPFLRRQCTAAWPGFSPPPFPCNHMPDAMAEMIPDTLPALSTAGERRVFAT